MMRLVARPRDDRSSSKKSTLESIYKFRAEVQFNADFLRLDEPWNRFYGKHIAVYWPRKYSRAGCCFVASEHARSRFRVQVAAVSSYLLSSFLLTTLQYYHCCTRESFRAPKVLIFYTIDLNLEYIFIFLYFQHF